jgi:hypothetical protein
MSQSGKWNSEKGWPFPGPNVVFRWKSEIVGGGDGHRWPFTGPLCIFLIGGKFESKNRDEMALFRSPEDRK